jgi:hypothetical protein
LIDRNGKKLDSMQKMLRQQSNNRQIDPETNDLEQIKK